MEVRFVESNPGRVKAAFGLMGLIEPVYRLPAVPPRPESLARIETILAGLGMLVPATAAKASRPGPRPWPTPRRAGDAPPPPAPSRPPCGAPPPRARPRPPPARGP